LTAVSEACYQRKTMTISRRNLLAQIGGIAAAAAFPVSSEISGKPLAASREVAKTGSIHLDRNENAYGPSQEACAAICESAASLNLYPTQADDLRGTIAAHHKVQPEQVVLGCGSREVLRMAAGAFLGPKDRLILASPSFDRIMLDAKTNGAEVIEIPLRKNYSHDLAAMLERTEGGAGIVYICNPNNPTGTLTERQEIERFLERLPGSFRAVIDEAYHQYAGSSVAYASFLDKPSGNKQTIVTRTFSKVHGLAGVRVGYGISDAETARKLRAGGLEFAASRPGILAAKAALGATQHIELCVKKNTDDRQEFFNQVNARMLRALDSHTNFVCLNVMRTAGQVVEHYRNNGIVLSPPIPAMPTYLRVALGTAQEMHEFWRVWDLLGPHPMKM
jgi:histidinol-phosphate aminotransferase